jgi:thiol:disulfide interchange protein
MENKLKQLKTFKQVTLNDEERNLLRAHAARIVIASPVIITESFFKRGVQHGLRIALSSMLFVVFIAGSVSAVANNALPGDPLYSFKVNVNEEVKGLFLKTPEEKVVYQKSRVEARVSEIQTLAESNSLTPANQATAESALNSNVATLSANLSALSSQSPNTALSVTASLEQTLKANKAAIESTPDTSTIDNTGKAAAINTVNATLQKVSNQEVQIISQEITNLNTAVNTVPDSASAALNASASSSPSTTSLPTTTTSGTSTTGSSQITPPPPTVTPATP